MDGSEAAASANAGLKIRRLRDRDDAERALELIYLTWGDGQPWSGELIRAMEAAGNLVLGAFADDRLVGFALGFYGDEGGLHFHSHMLAVRPESQRRGIGFALKQAQRAACLDAGVTVMRWTFDPLQVRNAAFNLNKLGAEADGFERDFYGTMDDTQSLGDRGDRLWARWDLDGPGRRAGAAAVRHVEVPDDYWQSRERDLVAAQRIRDAMAEALEGVFAEGLTAIAFRDGGYVFA